MKTKIPINKPSITSLEIDMVNDAVKNGWGERCYEYINKFEKDFSNYQQSKYALATSSCTGAIHLALMAMGVKAGDEVIVPEITWIASVEPVLYIGAKPVFVDVLPDSWCMDPLKLEAAITPKTKAIILVHVYGNLCEMNAIKGIAEKHGLKILEDAAEALGSEYYGKKAGSIGDAGVFSFHGTKTMTSGEGGILVTNDVQIYEQAKVLNDHGRNPKDPDNKMFWMRNYGYKYKMSNLEAALACAQLSRIDELVNRKRWIFNKYQQALAGLPCALNPEPKDCINSYWLPTVVFDERVNFNRDLFFEMCQKENIDSRPFFYPLSSLPMFEEQAANRTAYGVYKRAVNLPSYHDITEEEIARVVNVIKEYFKV